MDKIVLNVRVEFYKLDEEISTVNLGLGIWIKVVFFRTGEIIHQVQCLSCPLS